MKVVKAKFLVAASLLVLSPLASNGQAAESFRCSDQNGKDLAVGEFSYAADRWVVQNVIALYQGNDYVDVFADSEDCFMNGKWFSYIARNTASAVTYELSTEYSRGAYSGTLKITRSDMKTQEYPVHCVIK